MVIDSPFENERMATCGLSALPVEIHVIIAAYLRNPDILLTTRNRDILNLCLTSKRLHEGCFNVLYRHVELLFDPFGIAHLMTHENCLRWESLYKRQRRLVQTLLGHPGYAKCVRSLKGMLCIADFDPGHGSGQGTCMEEELWRAMQPLTHLKSVDVAFQTVFSREKPVPKRLFPTALFQIATSVRLVGYMHYGLSKSILDAIDPALLKHLCLDTVHDRKSGPSQDGFRPGDRGEDGRIIAFGATAGLLTKLTGKCTALRTLVLRRLGQAIEGESWHAGAEEASYTEWASFVRSVRGTVEKFTFEQSEEWVHPGQFPGPILDRIRIMDGRFRRLVFPVISSGAWPCLTVIKLRGVREDGTLLTKIMAGLGENLRIVVVDPKARNFVDSREMRRWN